MTTGTRNSTPNMTMDAMTQMSSVSPVSDAPQELQVDGGLRYLQGPGQVEQDQRHAGDQEGPGARREPPVLRALGRAVQGHYQPGGQRHRADEVEADVPVDDVVLAHDVVEQQEQSGDDAQRHVDQEYGWPADRVDQQAADRRADGRREEQDDAEPDGYLSSCRSCGRRAAGPWPPAPASRRRRPGGPGRRSASSSDGAKAQAAEASVKPSRLTRYTLLAPNRFDRNAQATRTAARASR